MSDSRILRAWTGANLEFDLNDGGRYFLDGDWTPAEPGMIDDAQYDTETSLVEEIPIGIMGLDRDELIENRAALARWLYRAARYQQDRRSGSARELEYAASGASNTARVEVLGGGVPMDGDIAGKSRDGKYIQKAMLRLKRRPVWEGAEETISLTTSPSNNGTGNVAVLPALDGDLPARCRIRITGSGGNIDNVKRILAALRFDQTPANFLHRLLVFGNPAGVSVTAGTATAISAADNFISTYKARYTPAGTSEVNILTWEITTPASVVDQLQRSLVVVRYRDNAAAANFRLRVRFGVKVSSLSVYGPWIPETPLKTKYADSTATTEIGALELGQAQIPGVDTLDQAPVTLLAQLAATAIAASNTLDIDCLAFNPVGESDFGKGLALAEFPVAVGSNRAYLDFRLRQPRAYLANANDVLLTPPTTLPEGGEILLWPQTAGQRLYFSLLRSLDDNTAPLGHDKGTSLTAAITYKPRYLFMRGTT